MLAPRLILLAEIVSAFRDTTVEHVGRYVEGFGDLANRPRVRPLDPCLKSSDRYLLDASQGSQFSLGECAPGPPIPQYGPKVRPIVA